MPENVLSDLESKVQLHQQVEIIYVVDGYVATFLDRDGNREVADAHAPTILQALVELGRKVSNYTRGD